MMLGNPQIIDGPNPQINYYVTQQNISQTICKSGWTGQVRPAVSYTDKIKFASIKMLHISLPAKTFELDHEVPLEVGGHPYHKENLKLQSWTGVDNAHMKDEVENYVKREVCSHKVTLTQGQSVFLEHRWQPIYAAIHKGHN